MKNIFIKILLIFAFILNLALLPSFAESLGISSVSLDNSGAFMSINSPDNLDYKLEKPQIMFVEEDNEAYFDLQPARLSGSDKNYIADTNEIHEISLSQISTTPDIVRVSIHCKEGYNPQNITIKRLNNTLFVRFKSPVMTNYYFQEVYKESGTTPVYETVSIAQKLSAQKNVLGEINSAFTIGTQNNAADNFVLSKKDLLLKSKYYINSLILKGDTPILNGMGTYTLTRPMYLTNPNRVAYDIKNTVVNPMLRNKDITLGNNLIKIGQFDHNTARIVITSEKPEIYLPVIFGDIQKIGFLNTKTTSPLNLYSTTSDMTAVTSEKGDSNNYSVKFAFSKPLVLGLNRLSDKLELSLFNVNHYYAGAIESELRTTAFENLKTSDIKSGGVKFTIPVSNDDKCDVYLGADGKTLRIKLHTAEKYTPKPQEPITEQIVVPTVTPKHTNGKKYVVIDAGHGGSDHGAIRNNINEKDITLDISKRVQKLLEKKGYEVAMTRTDDTYVGLQERVDFSEIFNPDIFVSIHVNSSNSETPSGLETHYYKDNSLTLAKHLHASMLNHINSKDRGLFKSKFYVINHTTAPAVLVEIGFLSNPSERVQLVTESRKNATAKAIAEGIDDYFKK